MNAGLDWRLVAVLAIGLSAAAAGCANLLGDGSYRIESDGGDDATDEGDAAIAPDGAAEH